MFNLPTVMERSLAKTAIAKTILFFLEFFHQSAERILLTMKEAVHAREGMPRRATLPPEDDGAKVVKEKEEEKGE